MFQVRGAYEVVVRDERFAGKLFEYRRAFIAEEFRIDASCSGRSLDLGASQKQSMTVPGKNNL